MSLGANWRETDYNKTRIQQMGFFKDTFSGEGKVMLVIQIENEYALKIFFYSCDRWEAGTCYNLRKSESTMRLNCIWRQTIGQSLPRSAASTDPLVSYNLKTQVAERWWTVLASDFPEECAVGNAEISTVLHLISFHLSPPSMPHNHTPHTTCSNLVSYSGSTSTARISGDHI